MVILALAAAILLLFRRFRLPGIVAFILTGMIAGPHGWGWVKEVEEVEALAEDCARLERRTGALRGHFANIQQDVRDIEITAEKIIRRSAAIRALDIPDETARAAE
ncbi:MAG: cation:proton antiporter [Flavobacteriales bacterium]